MHSLITEVPAFGVLTFTAYVFSYVHKKWWNDASREFKIKRQSIILSGFIRNIYFWEQEAFLFFFFCLKCKYCAMVYVLQMLERNFEKLLAGARRNTE